MYGLKPVPFTGSGIPAACKSGMPVPVTQATNNNAFAGIVLQRPNLIAKPSQAAKDRNPGRGPAYRDLDVALVKHVHLPRETGLEFRAEVFDVTNTPEFSQPNGSFGASAFGSITSTTTDPRVVQFAVRLSREGAWSTCEARI